MPAFLFAVTAFLSTPSARRATRDPRRRSGGPGISIHALREEGDCRFCRLCFAPPYFYPRPPRGGRPAVAVELVGAGNFYPRPPRGGRHPCISAGQSKNQFLSTPSARRATAAGNGRDDEKIFLSTPSARRATASSALLSAMKSTISIHALREEGDVVLCAGQVPPAISIHALREEGDKPATNPRSTSGDFYPRPPRGGRRVQLAEPASPGVFLSTPSARRATRQAERLRV